MLMETTASKTMTGPILVTGPSTSGIVNHDSSDKEDISEQLLNEIEGYLSEVIFQKEKVIDISDTSIGNFGASFVAEAIPECKALEEIHLSKCGIKDEGALLIFDKLKTCNTINILDLNGNSLTDKCFEGLI